MESKIAIDIDTSGQPQIRIDYRLTDDLRDKLIGRFLNWLGLPRSKGFWAYVRLGHEYQSKPGGPFDCAVAFIEPLDRKTLSAHMPEIKYALEDEYHKIDIDAPRSSEPPPDVDDKSLKSDILRLIDQAKEAINSERASTALSLLIRIEQFLES